MRALIQRVRASSVIIDHREHARIERGFLVFVGIGATDDAQTAHVLADKIAHLRLFENDAGNMHASIKDVGGSILLVSQFTLYADCTRGRRPSFGAAAAPAHAERIYNILIAALRDFDIPVQTGVFGADMQVQILNDGPVTIFLDINER